MNNGRIFRWIFTDCYLYTFNSIVNIFTTIDRFSNGFSVVGDRFIDFIVGIFTKIFSHKKSKKEEEEDNE